MKSLKGGIKAGFLFVLVASMAACGPAEPPHFAQQQQPIQQQAPVQYAQPQQSGIGTGTAIAGAAVVGTAAYMLGKANAEKANAPKQEVYRSRPAPQTQTWGQQPSQPVAAQQAPARPVMAPAAPAQVFKPQAAKTMTTVTAPRTSFSSSSKRR